MKRFSDFARHMRAKTGSALVVIGVTSALVNVLYLTSSFFMLQVYDRVIPSRSIPSLVALGLLAAMLYLFQGTLEWARNRMLTRISGVFDELLSHRVFSAVVKAPVKGRTNGDGLTMMRDFDQVRSFLSSPGPSALFDLPWLPIYIVICFLFHPVIGYIAIGGALALCGITFMTNRSVQSSAREIHEAADRRSSLLAASQRNAEVIAAMGMRNNLSGLWSVANDDYRLAYRTNSDTANGYATISKTFRVALQSVVLGTGAVLVIDNQASAGIIIASSILTSRALAPVEQAIANWRGLVAAQQSWKRLKMTLNSLAEETTPMSLQAPRRTVSLEGVSAGPPGTQDVLISNINFRVAAGSAVGVIGPSASGKSSLSRVLAGVWPVHRGVVRIDGAALDQWDDTVLGQHIGYLPQDIELFPGTVAQNISRFRPDFKPEEVIRAAEVAGVHELILKLPSGYATQLGAGGIMLSAGQRQRVALARALYRDPFLVILDEPNSNLDSQGEVALTEAIRTVRLRGGIVIVVAHRPNALSAVDFVLMMKDGRMAAFGPKEEILSNILHRDPPTATVSLKVVGEAKE